MATDGECTAVVHYKSRFSKTSVRVYVTSGGCNGDAPFEVLDDCTHNSPIHPDFVVFKVRFPSTGAVSFVPFDSTECIAYFCPDSGPLPKFAGQSWADGSKYSITESGTYVLADGELTKHSPYYSTVLDKFSGMLTEGSLPSKGKGRLALFLDIDGTLRGQGKILEFVRAWERTLALNGAILAFNTGRSDMSVYDFIEEISRVVVPTVAICRVGTEVRWFRTAEGWLPKNSPPIKDIDWAAELTQAGGWEYKRVLENIQGALVDHSRVRGRLCLPFTRTVPIPDYTTFILTFIVRRAYVPEAIRIVRQDLTEKTGIKVKLSIGGEGTDEQYLDVINAKAGKLGGLRYIREKYGTEFKPETCVMCGDAGNDLDAVDHDGTEKAVIVGNCEREMDTFWKKLIKARPEQKRVVRAKKHCAAGIVEGLRIHGFL